MRWLQIVFVLMHNLIRDRGELAIENLVLRHLLCSVQIEHCRRPLGLERLDAPLDPFRESNRFGEKLLANDQLPSLFIVGCHFFAVRFG